MYAAVNLSIRGRVQGVGFRPFIFQLASNYQLTGTVQNNMDGVKIHIEGKSENIDMFIEAIRNNAPRLSRIDEIITKDALTKGYDDFTIIESERAGTSMLVIPIDSAVCHDCLQEMKDNHDFRYKYPFINCTQCGPRYTIIKELPYDRPYTSMESFQMCDACLKEYEDPLNRRHHAQPIACPSCGPKVSLFNVKGEEQSCDDPISEVIDLIKQGNIIAIKGLGGYHLCCDANHNEAVKALRMRKKRPNRPLAIMAASIEAVSTFAIFSNEEQALLESPEAPIVVLQKRDRTDLAEEIAPGMETVGVMLPYTPLHHLLFEGSNLTCLVLTSANPSGMPILFKDEESFKYLSGIADYLLLHNREILHPVDDSVIQMNAGSNDFFRRSRGYVPDPITVPFNVSGIVAFGGQQKTTFTIGRNEQIFIGPHIGDLENIETIQHYKTELNHLLKWIQPEMKTAVIDSHPGFNIRQILTDYQFEEVIEVQHHHAHMAGCMAENGLTEKGYGIILDGTGYGLDGNVWGFEVFYGDQESFERSAHLVYTPLPGSEKAIKEPWRNAVAMLYSLLGSEGERLSHLLFPNRKLEINILKAMIDKNLNLVNAGTCGRLFDAVSAICRVAEISTYDGEAAIRLSELAYEPIKLDPYDFKIVEKDQLLNFDFTEMLKQIALDAMNGVHVSAISSRFHETIVQAIAAGMMILKQLHPERSNNIVLSGGSFHNRYIRKRLSEELTMAGFTVYSHKKVPCNDGGLSYGQLIVAAAKRRNTSCV